MDRYWENAGVAQAPAAPASSDGEYPTDGNLAGAVPPSTPGAWWYHQITEEIRNAIVKLGGTPDFTQVDQLATVLLASITSAIGDVTAQLAKVAYSGSYADLLNKPVLATVANTGIYADLLNKPDLTVYATNAALAADVANLQANINAKQPTGNYVTSADGHAYALSWTGNQVDVYVDTSNQGALYATTWYQPLALGGVGNVIITGQSVGPGATVVSPTVREGPQVSGTWLGCGEFSSGSDVFSLLVRVS